jgi:UDP-2,3-diacylglucosamine hydrolase
MSLKIKNGAIFIADSHEDENKSDFYDFLKKIDSKELPTEQLFLMGDMFDLLVGKVEYGVKKYEKYIKLIDEIALHVEVIYFEGNHDFGLNSLFKNVMVIPLEKQPQYAKLEDDTVVYLSHGDKYADFIHTTYTKIIRSKCVLKVLNTIDIISKYTISKKIEQSQLRKNLCRKIDDFEEIISSKLHLYKAEKGSYIVEGHYHQCHQFEQNGINYLNLPSFACNQSYIIVECFKDEKFALRGSNV